MNEEQHNNNLATPPSTETTAAPQASPEPSKPRGMRKGFVWDRRARRWVKREEYQSQRKSKSKPLPISPEKIDSTEKGKPSAKWRPARITDIPMEFKNPSRTYHFFRDTPNSLRKRIMEQWNIDMEIARKMDEAFGQRTLQSGTTVDGAYRVNELILMWMPKEMAEDRNKYFSDKAKVDSTAIREALRTNIGNEGGDRRAGVYTQHPSGVLPDMNKSEKWDGKI